MSKPKVSNVIDLHFASSVNTSTNDESDTPWEGDIPKYIILLTESCKVVHLARLNEDEVVDEYLYGELVLCHNNVNIITDEDKRSIVYFRELHDCLSVHVTLPLGEKVMKIIATGDLTGTGGVIEKLAEVMDRLEHGEDIDTIIP